MSFFPLLGILRVEHTKSNLVSRENPESKVGKSLKCKGNTSVRFEIAEKRGREKEAAQACKLVLLPLPSSLSQAISRVEGFRDALKREFSNRSDCSLISGALG